MLRILFFVLSCVVIAAPAQDSLSRSILFVGNSYTYFWNLPQSIEAMALSQGHQFLIRQSTSGGTNLGQHWRGEKELETVAKIRSGDYRSIILQDHSLQAINHPDSLQHYAEELASLISGNDVQVYLYMTWAREWNPMMISTIEEVYRKAAQSIGATVIPVGLAWQRARILRPLLQLYHPDGSHPSPSGTYLTACVVYAVLTGESPIGLPARLTMLDPNGERLYLNIQTEEDAKFLQEVAWEVVNHEE